MSIFRGLRALLVPMGYSERELSAYTDARLIVIPGAGHGYDGDDS